MFAFGRAHRRQRFVFIGLFVGRWSPPYKLAVARYFLPACRKYTFGWPAESTGRSCGRFPVGSRKNNAYHLGFVKKLTIWDYPNKTTRDLPYNSLSKYQQPATLHYGKLLICCFRLAKLSLKAKWCQTGNFCVRRPEGGGLPPVPLRASAGAPRVSKPVGCRPHAVRGGTPKKIYSRTPLRQVM